MSPGTKAGTGRPLWFKCRGCGRAMAHDVTLTGQKRLVGHNGNRVSAHSREYRCGQCGHTGWSRHRDLERKAGVVR